MKSMRPMFTLMAAAFLALAVLGCNGGGEQGGNQGGGVSLGLDNVSMSAYLTQSSVSTSFTADQIFTGTLTVINSTDANDVQVFPWSIYIDATDINNILTKSNNTVILFPGTYDFYLDVSNQAATQSYVGQALGWDVVDGTNDIPGPPLVLRPVIGQTTTSFGDIVRLADFKLSYPAAELAAFTTPQIGITVDTAAEQIFALNKTTGLSEQMFLNLSEGAHTIRLKFYDGGLQLGRSQPAQETPTVTAGARIAMDIVSLHGEVTLTPIANEASLVTFNFNIPEEVVNEVGGTGNLRAFFTVVGTANPALHEEVLALSPPADRAVSTDYTASSSVEGFQFGEVTITLDFSDNGGTPTNTLDDELIGQCAMTNVVLSDTNGLATCNITLRRRSVISGNLLSVVGVNVWDTNNAPVAGAVITMDGNVMGITGSGTFGTPGYLKFFHVSGTHTIRAKSDALGTYGEQLLTLNALSVDNVVLHATTAIPTGTAAVDSSARGWWNDLGDHDAANANTVTGFCNSQCADAPGRTMNSFFTFDTSGVTTVVEGAVLRLFVQGFNSDTATETVSVWDVSTDAATLAASGAGNTVVYNDLMSGVSYGSAAIGAANVNGSVDIPLSAEAVAAINATGMFSVGMNNSSIDSATADTSEWVRFSLGGEAPSAYQLILTVRDF